MSTVLYNPIVVNPQAYLVFPGLYELIPNTTDYIEYCTYTGILEIHIDNQLVKQYEHTDSIDLSEFINSQIRISLVTGLGSVLLGEWIIDESRIAIPESIRKNLVVWYDVAKQNATNESMQANPVCYNFAWSGMSGIGGRYVDADKVVINVSVNVLSRVWGYNVSPGHTMPEIEFSVIGLLEGQSCFLRVIGKNPESYNEERFRVDVENDGTYKTPSFTNDSQETEAYEIVVGKGTYNVTVEFLPQYPHALVSDGVDDYAMVGDLPILTKENGYTVVAKRKWIDSSSGEPKMLLSDGNDYGHESLMVENKQAGSDGFSALSFGSRTNVTLSESDIIYQTSTSYCGNSLSSGQEETESLFSIFSNFGLYDFSKVALYSLLLFDRDLTTSEIEQVKTNLIEQ